MQIHHPWPIFELHRLLLPEQYGVSYIFFSSFSQSQGSFHLYVPLKRGSSLLLFTWPGYSAQWGTFLALLRRTAVWACLAPPQDRLGQTVHYLGFFVFSVMSSREALSIGKFLELEKALFNKEYRREGMKIHTHTHTNRCGKQKPRRIWFVCPQ